MKQPLSAPAPIINLGTPITHILPNGLTILIVENHRLPQVTLRLLLDDQPTLEGDKKGVYDLLSLLVGNGSTNISKEAFNEEIDYMAVNINILPNGVYAQTLSKFFPRVLELIADAALHPNFEEEEIEREKARIVQSLKAGENNAEVIMKRVQQALRYTTAHPYGEYITEPTVSALTLTDVYDYYRSHFQPNHAYLVVAGDVNPDEAVRLVSSCFADWEAVNTPLVKLYDPQNVRQTEIDLIDLPTAVQSEIRFTNLISLSMNHPDYFPMLIANSILGGDFGSYINMNLREAHGYTYGASSGFKIDKWTKGAFSIKTKVSNAVTAPAIIETLNEIKRIQTQEVSAEKLSQAKAQYIGQFVMATERPQSTANYAINIRTQQLPANFYKNYIASLQNVTQADVQRVANTYFMLQNMRIIVVGKADEIKSSLEKAVFENYEMPVYQYNKYAEAKKN